MTGRLKALAAAGWVAAGVVAVASNGLPAAGTFGELTSAAVPATARVSVGSAILNVTPYPGTDPPNSALVNLGSFTAGQKVASIAALKVLQYDHALPLTFKVGGSLGSVITGLFLGPDGSTVRAALVQPLPQVSAQTVYTGPLIVTSGNDWAQANLQAQLVLNPEAPATPSLTVTGSVYGAVYSSTYGAQPGNRADDSLLFVPGA